MFSAARSAILFSAGWLLARSSARVKGFSEAGVLTLFTRILRIAPTVRRGNLLS